MAPTGSCLTEHALKLLIWGRATGDEADGALEHIDHCDACRAAFERLAAESVRSGAMPAAMGAWTPPPQIDEFLVKERLGSGAMGDVWLARDTLLERDVALKIAAEVATDEARLRFRVEARAVARLRHPNIVAVHHAGEIDERPFLVTELLRGHSLDHFDRRDPAAVVRIGADLARGLAAAHAAGVIHRDVKPANAFLCDDGVAKLLDFGLAQLRVEPEAAPATGPFPGADDTSEWFDGPESTQPAATGSGRVAGTPLYMAPETWRREGGTQLADVYSLGALLFTLLANRPPHGGASLADLRASVLAGDLPDLAAAAPRAPAPLARLVLRCLSLRPEARPSAEELCNALQAMLAPESDSRSDAAPSESDTSPYRGLLTFGFEHRGIFFGREVETAAVLTELRGAPFVLVAGSSGAGKSSLVRAGVVPAILAGGLGPEPWVAATMVPGEQPTLRLAQALAPILDAPEEEVAARVAAAPTWAAQRIVERSAGPRVLLVVDQFEEAWTLSSAREREALFEALAALTRVGPSVRVVVTLRADFLSKLKELGELRAQALRAPVVLGPLSSEGLRRAIVEPARRRGVEVDPEVAHRLVEAARDAPGMLPLLEFALGVLWERRAPDARRLSASDLDALGGLEGALAVHADAALARLEPRLKREARRLLLALVTVERTRARREERSLLDGSPDARSALDALIDARLVVASAGEETTAYEVAHEVLLSGWPTLRGWLDEESSARALVERLRRAAAEWERLGHGPEALLGERQLEEIDVLPAVSSEIVAFIDASSAAVRRARLRRLALAVGIPLVLALVGVVGWTVSLARHHAAFARTLAEARALDATAEETAGSADRARTEALALFEKDDLRPAEDLWKRALALEEDADRQRRDVGATLDAALALDPLDHDARALFADVLLARLLAAERLHEAALLPELRTRLDVYDDGSRAALLRAPARVRVETEPPGATLGLARYVEDAAGRLVETDRTPLVAGAERELEAGSYVIVAEAPGRAATRYPFLVHRAEARTLRIALARAADVPDGMIYVPAGRSLYGSADDEATRGFLMHQPIHEVDVGAFLMARTEVTNGDYIAFLEALPDAEREARVPGGLMLLDHGRIGWKQGKRTLAPGERYCGGDDEPCVDWLVLPVDSTSRVDGERYVEWLRRSGRLPGARLCTDREWERAARGADDRLFPIGNRELGGGEACNLATYGGDPHRAAPCAVGAHPASRSPFGVDDLAGNEWEWTSGPADVAQRELGVVRGAGFFGAGMYSSIPNRGVPSVAQRYAAYGLRVCADVAGVR